MQEGAGRPPTPKAHAPKEGTRHQGPYVLPPGLYRLSVAKQPLMWLGGWTKRREAKSVVSRVSGELLFEVLSIITALGLGQLACFLF